MMGWAHSSGPIAHSLFSDILGNYVEYERRLYGQLSCHRAFSRWASYHQASFGHPVLEEQEEAQRSPLQQFCRPFLFVLLFHTGLHRPLPLKFLWLHRFQFYLHLQCWDFNYTWRI